MELTDLDREEIARLIVDGCLAGRVDGEDYYIAWSLTTEKWEV